MTDFHKEKRSIYQVMKARDELDELKEQLTLANEKAAIIKSGAENDLYNLLNLLTNNKAGPYSPSIKGAPVLQWYDALRKECKTATEKAAEGDHLCDLIDTVRQENADYLSGTLEGKLKQQLESAAEKALRLEEFARYVIRQECWSIFEQDGGDIQELAKKLGLIVPHVATAEDVDDEFDDHEPGDTIFKFSDMLKETG